MNAVFSPQSATILRTEELNKSTRLFVLDISFGAKPGQFVNIWIPNLDEKPFSVASDDGKTMSIVVSAVGPFSTAFFEKNSGEKVGIRGPFGNTFSVQKNKKIVLVGGGFGTAPLHFLGTKSQAEECKITAIIGARTKDLLLFTDWCEKSGFRTLCTTNDGSAGTEGLVTNVLEKLLETEKIDLVQSCGPEKMMEAVAKLCQSKGVPSELSLERYMKCGFGLCGQCSCDGTLVCREGTVFSGEKALSLQDFGKFHRDAEGRKRYW
ncbi:dihydroorotate dehydrogenase electron transfer subunit [Candidatus Peregrinibacteria bacterium]|nr:MAG: dihydroorotate dehydrogenase electron transfer subunit [Candidatus Peregrinibacteria bacterium]